jgi:hypothetical protein
MSWETAIFRMIGAIGESVPSPLDDCCELNAQNPDLDITTKIGAAIRNKGIFGSVQYLKGPTFL